MLNFLKKKQKRIYLDHASGTPCSEEVLSHMLPFFRSQSYNPGGLYKESVKIRQIIEQARADVVDVLRARQGEIVFVDGATEANNLAIIGAVKFWQNKNPEKKAHIITTLVEHAAVLETCRKLESEGVEVTYLKVDEFGQISLKELKKVLRETTVIISIGYVNGEIGTITDIRGIMKIIRNYRKNIQSTYPYVHTDAVQAVNYVDEIGVPQLGIDLMTINASKIYGPKKIAVLFVKTGVHISPIIFGGNQERGLHSGTENVPYIIGMARSLSLARKLQSSESKRLRSLQFFLEKEITELFPDVILNSTAENRIPNILNLTFPNISHEELVIRLDAAGFMCSVKSACKAGEEGDSHVIRAIVGGNQSDRATGSLRISLGQVTTKKNVKKFLLSFKNIVEGMKETYKNYSME